MKNTLLSLVFITVAALFIAACGSTKTVASTAAKSTGSAFNPTGTWETLTSNTPMGNLKGSITFTQEGKGYKAIMNSSEGALPLENLVVEGNTMKGTFSYSGYTFTYTGTFDGDKLNGKISSDVGEFPVTGTKVK